MISVMAGVELMIEKRRMKYCNRGRGDDKVSEKHRAGASRINDDKEERRDEGM